MIFLILLFVIFLVAWALHLMQEAIARQEFSFMLAGTLVASAAASLVSVYLVMGNSVGYFAQTAQSPQAIDQAYRSIEEIIRAGNLEETGIYISDSSR